MPRRGIEPRLAVSNTAVLIRHTRKASISRQPVQESNLVSRFRKPLCAPKHLRATSIPTWIRTRARTFGGSDAIHYTIGIQSLKSRRLDSHQHEPVYKTGAFLSRATSAKHEREESNPVRQLWRLAALPGAHSCKAHGNKPRGRIDHYFSSGTFQYVSLMNFDQLSIRRLSRA